MKPSRFILTTVVVSMLGWGIAWAHELGKDASPEERAFAYRDGLLHSVSAQMGLMSAMAQGKMPANDAAFTRAANNLVVLSGIIPDAFGVKGVPEGSIAKPEIWDNWDDFLAKANDLTAKAEEIAGVAASGGVDKAKGLVRGVGEACGACHKAYKVKTD